MCPSRRDVVALAGAAAAAASFAFPARAQATGFAYQLYSSRQFGPLAATMAMLARLGYAAVEGGEPQFADAASLARTRDLLAETGLAMPTVHVGLGTLEREPARVIDVAEALGATRIYCAWLPAGERPSSASGWADVGRRLTAAGRPLRDAGLGFGWHNHDYEFVTTPEGAVPLAVLFEAAPELEWQADMGWVVRAGADPFHWLDALGARITSVHVKDVAPAGHNSAEGGWADIGTGIVPWRALMPALRDRGVASFVLEHDNPSDDARFARASLAAVRSY